MVRRYPFTTLSNSTPDILENGDDMYVYNDDRKRKHDYQDSILKQTLLHHDVMTRRNPSGTSNSSSHHSSHSSPGLVNQMHANIQPRRNRSSTTFVLGNGEEIQHGLLRGGRRGHSKPPPRGIRDSVTGGIIPPPLRSIEVRGSSSYGTAIDSMTRKEIMSQVKKSPSRTRGVSPSHSSTIRMSDDLLLQDSPKSFATDPALTARSSKERMIKKSFSSTSSNSPNFHMSKTGTRPNLVRKKRVPADPTRSLGLLEAKTDQDEDNRSVVSGLTTRAPSVWGDRVLNVVESGCLCFGVNLEKDVFGCVELFLDKLCFCCLLPGEDKESKPSNKDNLANTDLSEQKRQENLQQQLQDSLERESLLKKSLEANRQASLLSEMMASNSTERREEAEEKSAGEFQGLSKPYLYAKPAVEANSIWSKANVSCNTKSCVTFANGNVYVGEMNKKKDRIEGNGRTVYPNGDKYTGQYKNNMRHGFGKCRFASSGACYEGDWKKDEMHGKGMYLMADGSVYVGEFKNDKKDGSGMFTYANGDEYKGKYKCDLRSGLGEFKYGSDGCTYVGFWKSGLRHGQGEFVFKDGRKFVGMFKNGTADGKGKEMTFDHAANKFKVTKQGRWKYGKYMSSIGMV